MNNINYNGRIFRSWENSGNGEVNRETLFHYFQDGNLVWANYAGGGIIAGHLIATMGDDGVLDMRYHHVNEKNEIMTGICTSTPEILESGKLRMHEEWVWTSGDGSSGRSILQEV